MGRGGYLGGSTIIGPGRSWYVEPVPKPAEKPKIAKKKKKPSIARGDPTKVPRSRVVAKVKPPANRNTGLTIPDLIARAKTKVTAIESELRQTKLRLVALEAKLTGAKRALAETERTPCRSARGIALQLAKAKGVDKDQG